MAKKKKQEFSELRQDPIKGEWVVIATARAKRPDAFFGHSATTKQDIKTCPFEDPYSEHKPLFEYLKKGGKIPQKDWSTLVIRNKFPAFQEGKVKGLKKVGPYHTMPAVGFHDLVIAREHGKFIPDLSKDAMLDYVHAFLDVYTSIAKIKEVKYVSLIHNHGKEAGASIGHLHSQIFGTPVQPIDIKRSMNGAEKYFKKHKKCVHCEMVKFELKDKKRVIYQNKKFVSLVPFVTRAPFEIIIYPKDHQSDFRMLKKEDLKYFADALQTSLKKLQKGIQDPPFNFFIHSVPTNGKSYSFYHWHLVILPKIVTWAGFELGTGMEISPMIPEETAKFLRGVKI